MSQIERGIRSLLENAFLYNLFQWSVGATRARKNLIRDFAKPEAGMRILDIGCGPGTIIQYLPPSVHYVGLDSNRKYIDFATQKFGKGFTFLCENANRIEILRELPKFDLILALGLIHHLDDEESSKLFHFASQAVSHPGRLITLDGCYVENQSKISRYLLDRDRGQNIRTESAYKSLAKTHFQEVKTTLSNNMLRIPYDLLIMECFKSEKTGS